MAREVGRIVNAFSVGDYGHLQAMTASLDAYSKALRPWARVTAARVFDLVVAQDDYAWRQHSAEIGAGIRQLVESAPIGGTLQRFLADQVELITSLPLEAAQRVHRLTTEALPGGTRANEISAEILRTGDVTASRATLIARTEVSRTATGLVQARAQHIGSTHYIWHTAGDGTVRPGHRAMNGKVVAWDTPPTVDEGGREMQFHAGCIWNCRCWCEPIIEDI